MEAAFLNGVVAALRSLARANGATAADSSVKIVPEVGTDDALLTKAVQHLIQRGQPTYAVDSGSANAIVATLAPACVEYKQGMFVRIKAAAANTGPVTANFNGLGNKAVVDANGAALLKGAYQADNHLVLEYDGTAFRIIAGGVSIPDATSAFHVGNGATQTLTNAVYRVLDLGTQAGTIGSSAGTTFTAARAGLYLISASLSTVISFSGAANASINATLYKNGSVVPGVTNIVGLYSPTSGTGAYITGINTVVSLKVGDTVSVAEMVQGSSMSSLYVNGVDLYVTPLN
ncbi:hypothetical protein [Rhodopseudomonas palustris]|uniref:hypothetical protein n=1 Tax=Rhodopseudomonas palustris TaxID=1076 RepID=UPI0011B05851|nr:hypothetical protein [Rhodopseudomonas palustris]